MIKNALSKLISRLLLILSLAAPMQTSDLNWTTVQPEINYVTKTQFRSRTMETHVSESAVLPGWTLSGEEVGEWGEWISSGAEPVEANIDCEVQIIVHDEMITTEDGFIVPAYTEYIYRTRTRSYTFFRWSRWSAWQDALILPTSTREVERRTLYAVDENKLPSGLYITEISEIPMFPGTGCQLQYLPGVSTLAWHATNPSVASVSGSGYVSAHKPGASRIIATTQGGRHVAAMTVIVGQWEDNFLPSALPFISAETYAGSALGYVNLRDSSVTRIADRAFANCNDLRLVLAGHRAIDVAPSAFSGCGRVVFACESEGSVSEYASALGIPYYIIGEEEPFVPVSSVTLSTHDVTLSIGQSFDLGASVLPGDASLPDLLYSSSDPSVVTVDALGCMRAVAPGYAIVTAQAQDGSGAYDNCMVTVILADANGALPGEVSLRAAN